MTDILQEPEDKSKVRVISYARFSSRKQAKGSSIERQVNSAKEWCKENGYTLDESVKFEDKGVSAFSGANSQTGAFAGLQQMLATGEIPRGSILIVEALDRITRQNLLQAVALMSNLVVSGLTIVTVIDQKKWTAEMMNDLPSFLMSVMLLYRGHEESKTKSERLKKTFRIHREKGSKEAFGTAPGWLYRADKKSPWQVDEKKAEVVRRVFELSAAGFGSKAIAAKANAEGWIVPVRLNRTNGRWHAQMAGRILRNDAVIGQHQHRITTYAARSQHWRGLEVGDAIRNYYPPIISEELWFAARASINNRSVAKRRDTHYYNIFSGLNYCGWCGAPVHRKNGTKGHSRAQLTCADRIAGLTKCGTMSARNFDGPILQAIYEHSYQNFVSEQSTKNCDEIGALKIAIEANRNQTERIAEALTTSGGLIKAFVNKASALEREHDDLQSRLSQLEQAEAVKGDGVFDETFVHEAMKFLYLSDDEEAKESRAQLNVRLSRIVETIWIFGYDCAFIKYKNEVAIQVVPLPGKRLPSRAIPSSKHHVAPKEWLEPQKIVWEKHLAEGIVLPEPRRPKPVTWQPSGVLAPLYEDVEDAPFAHH